MEPNNQSSSSPRPLIDTENYALLSETFGFLPPFSSSPLFLSSSSLTASSFSSFLTKCNKFLIWLKQKEKEILSFQQNNDTQLVELRNEFFKLEKIIGIVNKKRDESIDILREEEFLKNDENLNSEMKMEIRNKVENIRSAWEGIFVVSSIEQKKFQKLINTSQIELVKKLESKLSFLEANMDECYEIRNHLPSKDNDFLQKILLNINDFKEKFQETKNIVKELNTIIIFPEESSDKVNEKDLRSLKDRWNRLFEKMEGLKNKEKTIKEFKKIYISMKDWIDKASYDLDEKLRVMTGRETNSVDKNKNNRNEKLFPQSSATDETPKRVLKRGCNLEDATSTVTTSSTLDPTADLEKTLKITKDMMEKQKDNFNRLKRLALSLLGVQQSTNASNKIVDNFHFHGSRNGRLFSSLNQHLSSIVDRWKIIHGKLNFMSEKLGRENFVVVAETSVEHRNEPISFNDKTENSDESYNKTNTVFYNDFRYKTIENKESFLGTRKEKTCDNANWIGSRNNCGGIQERFRNRNRSTSDYYDLKLNYKMEERRISETGNLFKNDVEKFIDNFLNSESCREPKDQCLEKKYLNKNVNSSKNIMLENSKQSQELSNKNDKVERKCLSAKARSSSYHFDTSRQSTFKYKKIFWNAKKNKNNYKKTTVPKNLFHQNENSLENKRGFEEKNFFLFYDLPLSDLNWPTLENTRKIAHKKREIKNENLYDNYLSCENEQTTSISDQFQTKVQTLTVKNGLEEVKLDSNENDFSEIFKNKKTNEIIKKNKKVKNIKPKERKKEKPFDSNASATVSSLSPDPYISSKIIHSKNKIQNRAKKCKKSRRPDFKTNSCSKLDSSGGEDGNKKKGALNEGIKSSSTASINAPNIGKMHLDLLKWLQQTEVSQVMISSSLTTLTSELSSKQENLSLYETFELFQEIEEKFNQQLKTLKIFKKNLTRGSFPLSSSHHSIFNSPMEHRSLSDKSKSSWLAIVKELDYRFETVLNRQTIIRKNIETIKLEQKINQNIGKVETNLEKQEQWLEMNLWRDKTSSDCEVLQGLREQYEVKVRLLERQKKVIEFTKVLINVLNQSKCTRKENLELNIGKVENLWKKFSEKIASNLRELELFLTGDTDLSNLPVNLNYFLDSINKKINGMKEIQNEECESKIMLESLRKELNEKFSLFEDLLNSSLYKDHEMAKQWIETSSSLDKKLLQSRMYHDSKYLGCLSKLNKWLDGFEKKLEIKECLFHNMSILQQKTYQLENFHRHNVSFERFYNDLVQFSQDLVSNNMRENFKIKVEQELNEVLGRWNYIQEKTLQTKENLLQIYEEFDGVIKELNKLENNLNETLKVGAKNDKISDDKTDWPISSLEESIEKLTKMKREDMVVMELKIKEISKKHSHTFMNEDGEIAVKKQHKMLSESLDEALLRLESKETQLANTYKFQSEKERRLQELDIMVDSGFKDVSRFTMKQLLELKENLSSEANLVLREPRIGENDLRLMLNDKDLQVDVKVNESFESNKSEEKNENIDIFDDSRDSKYSKTSESRLSFEVKKSLIGEKVTELQHEITKRMNIIQHHKSLTTHITSWLSEANKYLTDEIAPLNKLPSLLSTFSMKNMLVDYKCFLEHQLNNEVIKNFNCELQEMDSKLHGMDLGQLQRDTDLMNRMEDIKRRFRDCLKPPEYEEKLEIVQNEIKQLGIILEIANFEKQSRNKKDGNISKTDLKREKEGFEVEGKKQEDVNEEKHRERLVVSSLQGEEIEKKLFTVKQMYAKLSALKQDLETLLRLGRTMVEEGGPLKIIADPAAFTQTLNQLKMFFNILGNKVSKTKSNFEKLIEKRKEINDTMDQIEKKLGGLSQVIPKTPDSNNDSSYNKILDDGLCELEELVHSCEGKLKEHSEIIEENFIKTFNEKNNLLRGEIEDLKKILKQKKQEVDNNHIENIWNMRKSKEVFEADQTTVSSSNDVKINYETSEISKDVREKLLKKDNLEVFKDEKEGCNKETKEKVSRVETPSKDLSQEANTFNNSTENINHVNKKETTLTNKNEPKRENNPIDSITSRDFHREYDKIKKHTPSITRFIFSDETEFDIAKKHEDCRKDEDVFDSGDDGNESDNDDDEDNCVTKDKQLKDLQKYLKLFSNFKHRVERSGDDDEFSKLLSLNFHCLNYFSEALQDFQAKRRNAHVKMLSVEKRVKMVEKAYLNKEENVDLKNASKLFKSLKNLEQKDFVQLEEEITENVHNYFEKNEINVNDNIQKLIVEKVKIFQIDNFDFLSRTMCARMERLHKDFKQIFTWHVPHSSLRLNKTVVPPWQRAQASQSQVPYYINHHTQDTQWMHPNLTQFLKDIDHLSAVRYSAYRVALKLQKLAEIVLFDKMPAEKVMKTIKNFEYKNEEKLVEQIMSKYKICRNVGEKNDEKLESDTEKDVFYHKTDESPSSSDTTTYSIAECYHFISECLREDIQDGGNGFRNNDTESFKKCDDVCNQEFMDENQNKKTKQKKNYNKTIGKRKTKNLDPNKNEGELVSSKFFDKKNGVETNKDLTEMNGAHNNEFSKTPLAIETIMSCLVECFDKEKKGRLGKTEVHAFLITLTHTPSINLKYQCLLDLIAREDKIANLPESFARQTENYDFLIKEPNPLISRSLNSKRKSSFVENAETSFATKSNFTASVTASLAPLFPSALAFKQKPYKFNKNDSSITTKHSNKLEKFEAKKRSSSLPSKIKTKTVLKKDSNKILVAEKSQLRKLLICLLQLPRLLGEAASFPDDDVGQMFEEFSAKYASSEFVATQDALALFKRGDCSPLAWFSCYYRISMAISVVHDGVCCVCGVTPYHGLKYRCLRCFNFNCCQNCFLYKKTIDETQNENKKNNISNNKTIDKSDGGKVSSNGTRRSRHKITHPMQEYWTETSVLDTMKDFPIIIRNRLRSRESLRSHNISGYLLTPKQNEKTSFECQTVTTKPSQSLNETVDNNKENKISKKQKTIKNKKIDNSNDKTKPKKKNFLKRFFRSSSLNNLHEIADDKFKNQNSVYNTDGKKSIETHVKPQDPSDEIRKYHTVARSKFDHHESLSHRNDQCREESPTKEYKLEAGDNGSADEHHLIAKYSRLMRKEAKNSGNEMIPMQLTHKQQLEAAIRALNKENKFLLKEMQKRRKKYEVENSENEYKSPRSNKKTQNSSKTLHNKSPIQKLERSNV